MMRLVIATAIIYGIVTAGYAAWLLATWPHVSQREATRKAALFGLPLLTILAMFVVALLAGR